MKLLLWTLWIVLIFLSLLGSCVGINGTKRAGKGAKKPATKLGKPPPGTPTKVNDHTSATSFKSSLDKEKVNSGDVSALESYNAALGHGGTYENVKSVVSSLNLIESDHAPHSSIMEYLENVPKLPDSLKKVVDERVKLRNEFEASDYSANEKKIADLQKEVEALEDTVYGPKPRPQKTRKNWPKPLQKQYLDTLTAYKKLSTSDKDGTVGQDLLKKLKAIREKGRGPDPIPDKVKMEELDKKQQEVDVLESVNRDLSRELENFVETMKGRMGVLSIPYLEHRLFPSTGKIGIPESIVKLKEGGVAEAAIEVDAFRKEWTKAMKAGADLK